MHQTLAQITSRTSKNQNLQKKQLSSHQNLLYSSSYSVCNLQRSTTASSRTGTVTASMIELALSCSQSNLSGLWEFGTKWTGKRTITLRSSRSISCWTNSRFGHKHLFGFQEFPNGKQSGSQESGSRTLVHITHASPRNGPRRKRIRRSKHAWKKTL